MNLKTSENQELTALRQGCGIIAAALAIGELVDRMLARYLAAAHLSSISIILIGAAVRCALILGLCLLSHKTANIRPMLVFPQKKQAFLAVEAYFALLGAAIAINSAISALLKSTVEYPAISAQYLVRVLLISPAVETLVFMLLPQAVIYKFSSPAASSLFCAVCFALAHNAPAAPGALILGTVLCAACRVSAPLCFALHSLHNLLTLLWYYCLSHGYVAAYIAAVLALSLLSIHSLRRHGTHFRNTIVLDRHVLSAMFWQLPFAMLCAVCAARYGGVL